MLPLCHSERQARREAGESEEPRRHAVRQLSAETLRFAQGDSNDTGKTHAVQEILRKI